MNEKYPELLSCPFCGGEAHMFGREVKESVDGTWAEKSRKEWWVRSYCAPACFLGMAQADAWGVVDGIHYKTPEAAARAWNRRKE